MLGILAQLYADLLGVATFTSHTRRGAGDRGGDAARRRERDGSGARVRSVHEALPPVGSGRFLGVLPP